MLQARLPFELNIFVEVERVQNISEEPHPRLFPLYCSYLPFELCVSTLCFPGYHPIRIVIRLFAYSNGDVSLASPLVSISPSIWFVGFVLCGCLSFRDGSIPSSCSHIDCIAGWTTQHVSCGFDLVGLWILCRSLSWVYRSVDGRSGRSAIDVVEHLEECDDGVVWRCVTLASGVMR